MPNDLSKKRVTSIGVAPEKTIRMIFGVTDRRSLALGLLRKFPLQLAENESNLNYLVFDGSPYDLIIGDLAIEELGGVLYIGNMLSSFTIVDEVFQVLMEPDCVLEDIDNMDGTDSKDFKSASSEAICTEKSDNVRKNLFSSFMRLVEVILSMKLVSVTEDQVIIIQRWICISRQFIFHADRARGSNHY